VNRLQLSAFSALVLATVAAFFIAQHLKVTTPLLNGSPAPLPAAFDPLYGFSGHGVAEPRVCWSRSRKVGLPGGRTKTIPAAPLDYRQTFTTFYLQHQSGHVDVYIVNTAGQTIRTLRSSYNFTRTKIRNPPGAFRWNGKEANGQLAPDGTYYYKVLLISKSRPPVTINPPLTIVTTPPRPTVTRVTGIDAAGRSSVAPVLISPQTATATAGATVPTRVRIHYSAGVSEFGGVPKAVRVEILRTDLPGTPRPVFSFAVPARGHTAVWNGLIHDAPAPAGTYLVGLQVIDAACNVGSFPAENPPVPGTTPHAGVTVTYLAAQVPLTAVPAGSAATVYVDSRQQPYHWALRLAGTQAVLAQGAAEDYTLHVSLPSTGPGLYELAIRSGARRTLVPLVASAAPTSAPRPILVVLPALTWQGLNPVDDDGDGQPNTLSDGGPVQLARPLADGIPAGFPDEVALLSELRRAGFHYDLTTDLGLLSDPAALLARHRGVVLAGSEMWLPTALSTALRSYAQAGGHVLSLGADSLQRTVTISDGDARDPSPATSIDAFGAGHGSLVSDNRYPLLAFGPDPLGLFAGSSEDFSGLRSFQPITPPAGVLTSRAGISSQQSAIAGFHLGRGAVVEIGLSDFGADVTHNPDLRSVLARAWRLLGS
jgi:hypothetical protein